MLSSVWDDGRFALRQLRRSPGFAITTVLTLAIGLGANLAIFQLLYAVLLAPLPVSEPQQLYSLHAVASPFDGQWFFSFPAYRRLRESTEAKAPVFARSGFGTGVMQETDGASSRVEFQMVSDNFFGVLGLRPAAGRFFVEGDDQQAPAEWPVILREGFYREHFSGSPTAIGKRATLDGIPIVVVGVAPEHFNGVVPGQAPDVWLPLAAQTTGRFNAWFDSLGPGHDVHLGQPWHRQPSIFWLWVLVRMPQERNAAEGNAALTGQWTQALAPDLSMMAAAAKDAPERRRILGSQVKLVSAARGEGSLAKAYALPLMILMGMAVMILLVGCLNLANLQMARLQDREVEIATRIALGASRARVLRQVAIEAVLLATIGGSLALLTARSASSLLLHWASSGERTIPIDPRIGNLAMLLGLALLLAALLGFALWPAWQMTRKRVAVIGGGSGHLSSQGKAARRWSDLLLASQVCFSLLLLSTAALFGQTLRNLSRVDTGMDRERVLSVKLDMGGTGFARQQPNLPLFYDQVIERLKALPMVRDAAVHMCNIPNCGWNTAVHVFGNPNLPEPQLHGEEDHVGVGYFQTLGIPILQGRDFTRADDEGSQPVAILSRSYARKLFGNESPVGHWVGYSGPPADHDFLVVGEVADARVDGLHAEAPPVAYFSIAQRPQPAQSIEVRVRGSSQGLSGQGVPGEIRESLHQLAPALPVTEIVPLDLQFREGLTREMLLARLTGIFAALALALAALGFYGLLSFRVARRTFEIGIRMALGSTRSQVRVLFLTQTLRILMTGVVPGAALAVAASYLARKVLYGGGSMDVWALGFAVAVLVAAGLLAALLPANRAATVEPMRALRSE
ncbi:MAG: ADOP family duplicated permease [Acidobacteriaceae bacterium]